MTRKPSFFFFWSSSGRTGPPRRRSARHTFADSPEAPEIPSRGN
jgi:hypothetical protein